ncbi:MAG: hypothetical protein QW270_07275 [Candidatus Bathyarchaeia archaeon]
MNKKKPTSLVIISLLLSALAITYIPTIVPTVLAYPGTVKHSATISPTTKTLGTLPQYANYTINVTSTGTDCINWTCIKLPTEWVNGTTTPPENWTIAEKGSGWLNFTLTDDSGWTEFANGTTLSFIINATPSMIPTVGTWEIYCYSGNDKNASSETNPVTLTVNVKLKFSSVMSPNYVMNGTSYIYTITTTNDECSVGIKQVNITFPAAGWTFNVLVDYSPNTWTVTYDSAASTFKLTGPNILIGQSVMIKVNMTVPSGASTGTHYWNSSAWDSSDTYLGKYSIKAVIDATTPTVTINNPSPSETYYSVGSGNYIWINVTVSDQPDIETYGITVTINDTTRFQAHPIKPYEKVSSTQYRYFFVNKTAIADGDLAVKVSATDPAGNTGSAEKSTVIDNTAPTLLWVKVLDGANELPYVSGIFWMGATTTSIQVNASLYDPSSFDGTIYLNTTTASFPNGTTLWPSSGFSVSGSDYVTLNITLLDNASPTKNRFTQLWEIRRDKVSPSAPTFTPEAICGGVVIRQITATDNVGVLKYRIYVNGTTSEVSIEDLNSTTLKNLANVPFTGNTSIAFSGVLVLNLTVYAGKTVNLTLCTIDYGANSSNATTYILSVPQGLWYPIELQKDWNLISLPLVPANSSITNVLSLLLKAGTLVSVWHYDAETSSWHSHAPGAPPDLTTMVDGKGYFIKVTAYNILIIQGTEQPPPPSTPRVYHVVPGWNLIGYKRLDVVNASTYLSGVDWVRLYMFDAATQTYQYVLPSGNMAIGLGYWVAVRTEGWIYP